MPQLLYDQGVLSQRGTLSLSASILALRVMGKQ